MSNREFSQGRSVALAYRKFVYSISWCNAFAVTLTPRQVLFQGERLTEAELRQNTRHFLNRLRKRFFGNKRSVDFQRLVVVEHQPHLHLHCIVDVPELLDPETAGQIIVEEWSKTRWGTKNVCVNRLATLGWIDYMMKRRSKDRGVAECFDFENSSFKTKDYDAGASL